MSAPNSPFPKQQVLEQLMQSLERAEALEKEIEELRSKLRKEEFLLDLLMHLLLEQEGAE